MQLFISYARDNMVPVLEAVQILRAGGHEVWFDEQLLPGQDWKKELANAISECKAFVYAITEDSLISEWCQWELATAARLRKPIIPLLLEQRLVIPDCLLKLQFSDFTAGATPIAVAKLMSALSSLQRLADTDLPPAPTDPTGLPARAWSGKAHWTDLLTPSIFGPVDDQEDLIGKFYVQLIRGIVTASSGRLLLTTQRVLYEPDVLSRSYARFIGGGQIELPISDIIDVKLNNTLGPLMGEVILKCESGVKHKFSCYLARRLAESLNKLRDSSQNN